MPDPTTLTGVQRKILTAITDAMDSRGYPPSMWELADAVGLRSASAVYYQLQALEAKGYVRRAPKTPRGIVIVRPSSAVCCPTCGQPTPPATEAT